MNGNAENQYLESSVWSLVTKSNALARTRHQNQTLKLMKEDCKND